MRRHSGPHAWRVGERNRLYLSDAEDAVLGGFVSRHGENVQAVSTHQRVLHLGVGPDVGVQGSNLTHHGAGLAQLGNAELIHALEEEITRFSFGPTHSLSV